MLEFRNNERAKIGEKYAPPDKLAFDRRMVYDRFSRMKYGRVLKEGINIETKWDKWLKQYEAYRPAKTDDWQSNITPPLTGTVVERALAEIIDQTMRPRAWERGPEDKAAAKIINYTMDYTWFIGDGDLELYDTLKQCLILGKTVWQEYYRIDKRLVKVLTKFDKEKGEKTFEKREFYDFDDVYGENVPLWDFFIDPNARTINRGRYRANDCIRRYVVNYDTFMESFKDSIWDPFGATRFVKPGGDTSYYQYYSPPQDMDGDQVELLFYWGRTPDKMIITANDVVINDEPNPYNHKQLPFAEGSDVKTLGQFYAYGEPALVESLQDEATTIRRMRLDRQHLDIWKMFLINENEHIDEEDAIVSPSRFLKVRDVNTGIKALEFRDINPSAYREEEILKQEIREITGIESPQPSSTATDAAIQKEATMRSLRLKIWLLSRELMTQIAKLRAANIAQFYTEPRIERIVGEKRIEEYRKIVTKDVLLMRGRDGELLERPQKGRNFFEIKPEDIRLVYGGLDFEFKGEPELPVSKPLMQQRSIEFVQNPIIAGAIDAGYYEIGKVADWLSEKHDVDVEQFKAQVQGQDMGQGMIDPRQQLELANMQNELLMQGQEVPATPYVNMQHLGVHLAFMESEEFKKVAGSDENIMRNFLKHTMTEAKAIELRGGEQPQQGVPGVTAPGGGNAAASILAGGASAAQPGKVQGGELISG